MSIFLAPLAAGLVGLAAMAIPGVRRHGHAAGARGHHAGGARAHGHAPGHARGHARGRGFGGQKGLRARILPEPRTVLSFLALYGAFGNALAAIGVSTPVAALVAVVPAAFVELAFAGPLFRLALRFEGRPSTPLDSLLAEEATALTEFRNGRGVVETVRDGRAIQLSARLAPDQSTLGVRTGERVRIVGVEADRQRVTVSIV